MQADSRAKPAGSLAEFVAPEVISRIVVIQYAGSPDDVRRYFTALPTAAAQYFGRALDLCEVQPSSNGAPATGVELVWTSTAFGLSRAPDCVGLDKVPVDSLYVSYVDPDGYRWSFAVPLQRKK